MHTEMDLLQKFETHIQCLMEAFSPPLKKSISSLPSSSKSICSIWISADAFSHLSGHPHTMKNEFRQLVSHLFGIRYYVCYGVNLYQDYDALWSTMLVYGFLGQVGPELQALCKRDFWNFWHQLGVTSTGQWCYIQIGKEKEMLGSYLSPEPHIVLGKTLAGNYVGIMTGVEN
jgi:hypothetical protein